MFHLTSRVAPYPNLIQQEATEMPWFVTVWRPLSSAFAESWKIYGEMGNFSIWITGLRRGPDGCGCNRIPNVEASGCPGG